MIEKDENLSGGYASGHDVDTRDDENVTVLGDPLLMRRATPSAPAHDSVDVELLFMEQRRRLVNLAAAITLDRSTAEEVVQDAFTGLPHRASDVSDPVLVPAPVRRESSDLRDPTSPDCCPVRGGSGRGEP